jgi:hypothetical protein
VRVAPAQPSFLAPYARAGGDHGSDRGPLLVARSADGDDVAIERLEAPLAALLERAVAVVPAPELERLVVTLGGAPSDASGVIRNLREDALLV